jgi:hypothetical protein
LELKHLLVIHSILALLLEAPTNLAFNLLVRCHYGFIMGVEVFSIQGQVLLDCNCLRLRLAPELGSCQLFLPLRAVLSLFVFVCMYLTVHEGVCFQLDITSSQEHFLGIIWVWRLQDDSSVSTQVIEKLSLSILWILALVLKALDLDNPRHTGSRNHS